MSISFPLDWNKSIELLTSQKVLEIGYKNSFFRILYPKNANSRRLCHVGHIRY